MDTLRNRAVLNTHKTKVGHSFTSAITKMATSKAWSLQCQNCKTLIELHRA